MEKSKLKPKDVLTIDVHNYGNIPLIVTNSSAQILYMTHIKKEGSPFSIRKKVLELTRQILEKYDINIIILEQNKLFIDKIDKYPDPILLRNIMLGFGIKVTLEDNFFNDLAIIELSDFDWKHIVLNGKVAYSIDLYKAHILKRTDIPLKQLVVIENNNYYKAVCLSESVLSGVLMTTKYQSNKGE